MVASTITAPPATPSLSSTRRRPPRTRVTVSRPPILIEFSETLVKAGYVGQARAMHVATTRALSITTSTAADCYRCYSPVLQQVLAFLGQEISDRKAIVIFDSFFLKKTLHQALERILWDAGLQAVSFFPAMELAAFAMPAPSMMIIYLSTSAISTNSFDCNCGGCEAHCLAHASGQVLEYTYQAASCCLCGGAAAATTKMDCLDIRSSHSLVMAIAKCLEACPIQVRQQVVSNLVFCGRVFPGMNVQVARKLRAVLAGEEDKLENRTSSILATEKKELLSLSEGVVYTRVPLSSQLRALSRSVGVIQIPNNIRPELYAWIGASTWAAYWHGREPEAERFRWKKPPPVAAATTQTS